MPSGLALTCSPYAYRRMPGLKRMPGHPAGVRDFHSRKFASAYHATSLTADFEEEVNSVSLAASQLETETQARELLSRIRSLDPAARHPLLSEARNASLSHIFNSSSSEPFYKVFVGNNESFEIKNSEGITVIAGDTSISLSKQRDNMDGMAVVKAKDGSVWNIVADGMGCSKYSGLIAEVFLHAFASRLSQIEDPNKSTVQHVALQASEEVETIRLHLAAVIIYNFIVDYFADGFDFSQVKSILQISKQLRSLATKLENEFGSEPTIQISSQILRMLVRQFEQELDLDQIWDELNEWIFSDARGEQFRTSEIFTNHKNPKDRTREPESVFVAVRTWEKAGQKYSQTFHVGDSKAKITEQKIGETSFTVVHETKDHSWIQTIDDKIGIISIIPGNLSDDERRRLAEKIKRNHPQSNIVTSGICYAGISGEFTASDVLLLKSGYMYTIYVVSDGHNPDDELLKAVQTKQSAGDKLRVVLEMYEDRYQTACDRRVRVEAINSLKRYFEAAKPMILAQIDDLMKQNGSAQEIKDLQELIYQTELTIQMDDDWLKDNTISLPGYGIIIEEEFSDDHTMMVGVVVG